MPENIFSAVPVDKLLPVEGTNTYWIQAWRYSSWDHPLYGEVNVDDNFGSQLIQNYRDQVYGQDLPFDFEHGKDPTKGAQASGWIRDMDMRPDGIYYKVEFTEDAIGEIKAGKWKYISPSYSEAWTNDETGESFDNVPTGGALTNRPYFKGMLPLNFSEIDETELDTREFAAEWYQIAHDILADIQLDREFAVWTTAYMNDLPDSAFLYIEPGGTKDSDGKTTPRSKRHFPVKDANGKVDLAHVRNALARIPQSNVSSAAKSAAVAKARRMLNQSRDNSEGGNDMNEESFRKFCELLGIEAPAEFTEDSILTVGNTLKAQLDPLKAAQLAADKNKTFREQFPAEYEKMRQLEERRITADARDFASTYERFTIKKDDKEEKDTRGFSSLVLTKIEEAHRAFSEGNATPETLKDVLDHIASGGIVDYKEYGSARQKDQTFAGADLNDVKEVRRVFSELVTEIMTEDNLKFEEALKEAAKREPDLFDAYMKPAVA
jgi:hypothetical protein